MVSISNSMNKIKYGIGTGLESLKFLLKNKDIAIFYSLSTTAFVIPLAMLFAMLVYVMMTMTNSNLSVGISASIFVIYLIYTFGLFFIRGIIIHSVGNRMIGNNVSIFESISKVLNKPFLLLKWAIFTVLAELLFSILKGDNKFKKTISNMSQSIWYFSTFFIIQVLLFYSEDNTKDELLKSVQVLKKQLIPILSFKLTIQILLSVGTVISFIITVLLFIILSSFISIQIELFIILFCTFMFILYAIWLIEKVTYDIARTALYMNAELDEELIGFDKNILEYDSSMDMSPNFIPEKIQNEINSWTEDGEFENRLK